MLLNIVVICDSSFSDWTDTAVNESASFSCRCRCSRQACFDLEVLLCSTVWRTLPLLLPSTCGTRTADRHSQGLPFKTHFERWSERHCTQIFTLLEWVSTVPPEVFWELFSGNKGLGLHSYQITQIRTLFKNVWTFDTVFVHPDVMWPCISDK